MSDEFDNNARFSSFWPLAILTGGIFIWFAVQDISLNAQRSYLTQQFQTAIPTIQAAQAWQKRYNEMIQDLYQTASKDQAAAPIAKEAVQAGIQQGLIHVSQQQGGTNSVANPSAPATAPK